MRSFFIQQIKDIEPFELNGKTIDDCYELDQKTLILNFTDGSSIKIKVIDRNDSLEIKRN